MMGQTAFLFAKANQNIHRMKEQLARTEIRTPEDLRHFAMWLNRMSDDTWGQVNQLDYLEEEEALVNNHLFRLKRDDKGGRIR